MIDDEDRREFRDAMRGVRPLRSAGKAPKPARRRRPRARFARAESQAVLADSLADLREPLAPLIDTGEEILYRGPRISEPVFRRLRRGEYRVEAQIDLHGLNAEQARQELRAFLAAALAQGLRVVRVVHGKGLRSGQRGPVLRRLVNDMLRRLEPVLAFASPREVDGGAGACLVLLQKPDPGPRRSAARR